MEQWEFEITQEKWAALESMKGIILSLEVTDKTDNQRTLEDHFYEAQGTPGVACHCIYACRSSDAQTLPRKEPPPSSIGGLLGRSPSRKNKAANCRGPYSESDTTTNCGVQTI
jgi:hypothetical protein